MPMKQPMSTQAQKATREMRSGGAVGWGPVGERPGGVAGQALVELCGGEDATEKGGHACSNGGEDDDGEQKGKEAREKSGEFDKDALCGLSKSEFDLLPHELGLLTGASGRC